MIKVIKVAEPAVLANNKQQWKQDLLDCIQKLKNNPSDNTLKAEKDKLENKYNHQEVKDALYKSNTKLKCVFCESEITTIDKDIEHFYPKVLYPELTFEWNNLLLSCKTCNNNKRNYDTKLNPFVNPMIDNPEDYFTYSDVNIDSEDLKGQNIINRLRLKNRYDIIIRHFNAYTELLKTENSLKEKLKHIKELTQNEAVISNISDILNTFYVYCNLCESDKVDAGYMRYKLAHSSVFQEALDLVNHHQSELGLSEPFRFY